MYRLGIVRKKEVRPFGQLLSLSLFNTEADYRNLIKCKVYVRVYVEHNYVWYVKHLLT
jgi:hypothetical protein